MPRERGLGEGWRGRLGLADVSFGIRQNGETTRSYYAAKRIMVSILR